MRTILFCLLLFTTGVSLADTIQGTIQFANRVKTGLPVSGTVKMIHASPGQSISKGQKLLTLDKVPFESSVTRARSNVDLSKADYTDAKRELEHAQELYDREVLSTVELEKATLNEQRAKARYERAKAELAEAEYYLKNSVIVAPFDGWVLDVKVKEGESVNNALSTQDLLSIAESNWYNASFNVPLKAIRSLSLSKSVNIKVGGKKFAGEIIATSLEPIDSKGGNTRYEVKIKFNSKGQLLRAGENASINIPN